MPTPEQLDEDYPDFNYVKIIRLTDKAVCFEMEDMTEGLWLPFHVDLPLALASYHRPSQPWQ